MEQTKAAIEAILFAMGDSVALSDLAQALELPPEQVKDLLHEMMERYREEDRGIALLELEDHYQLCTKTEYYDVLIRLAAAPKKAVLTDVMMETLAIVAYRQPVTRMEIERIRGVKSDHAVNKLLEYGLIEEAGRMNAPGRPILFVTTEEFLKRFGLSTLQQLPHLQSWEREEFRAEAEAEVPLAQEAAK